MRNRKTLLFLVMAMAIIALFAVTEVMANGITPSGECTLIFPGKRNKPDIEIKVLNVIDANGQIVFHLTGPKDVTIPDGRTISLACPDGYPCDAVALVIPGNKLNVAYASMDRGAYYRLIAVTGSTQGYETYDSCTEAKLAGCDIGSVKITAQTNTPDPQRLIFYFSQDPVDPLVNGRGDFIGGYGSDEEFCKNDGIIMPTTTEKSTLLTSSAAWKCKYLAQIQTDQGIVPVTARYYVGEDGCYVDLSKTENIQYFANNPECIVPCNSVPGCVELPKGQGTRAYRKYCMGTDGCNQCVESKHGSPQEFWYWNNGQESYSCIDLANPPTYACPGECYENAECP